MESSWNQNEEGDKPVIVRVKRKVGQSLLDAFWLERPLKRPTLDFSKIYIYNSSEKEDLKRKKVLVRHLETLTESETTAHIIHSFFESELNEKIGSDGKLEKRKIAFKKDNIKEQRLTKAVQQQQIARFEQIWRSRNKENIHDKKLHDKCHFYDVIRVDAEERQDNEPEFTSLEDQEHQKKFASFLPLVRECIPTAAEEIEADIHSRHTEEYVYDLYAVNEEMDSSEDSSKNRLPLLIVEDEEEFCYRPPEESDYYDSDDSNAEEHPRNDYPEEISEEEEEEDDDDDGEDEKNEASDESDKTETSERHVRSVLGDYDYETYEENENGFRTLNL